MSIRTVLISRNMSANAAIPNGRPVGRVIQLSDGDNTAALDAKPAMALIFYWKTVELTDLESDAIKADSSNADKTVDLDCFSAGDITTLSVRGAVAAGLGGAITNANFITVAV